MKEVHDGEETDARNEQTKPHERDKFQCRQQHRFPAETRPHAQSPEAAASVRAPPANQRGFTRTQKLTTRKDSSVHAAAIRSASINIAPTLCRSVMMTSDLLQGSRCQRTCVVGIGRQLLLAEWSRSSCSP